MLRDLREPLFRGIESLLALKTERSGDHCDGENTELSGHFGDDRRSARPCTTTHARCHEHHVRSVQGVGDAVTIFEGRRSPHLGVGAGAQAFRNTRAQLQHRLRTDIRKGLRVSIGANKIHTVDLVIDHVAHGVTATATNTDHLDHGTLWCTVY